MTALKKAGFNAQQRVRMLLQQPPTIESTLRVGDWHADSRLCYLAANDLAARGTVKGLSGNQWRMCSELARATGISSRAMVPNPSDLLNVNKANAIISVFNPSLLAGLDPRYLSLVSADHILLKT